MLTAKRVESAKGVLIHLEGNIDETTDFNQLIGPLPPVLGVHCGGVNRMNSVGILGWLKYFGQAQSQGTKLFFVECSPAVVVQINAISNFLCGGFVHSIQLGYTCGSCGSHFTENRRVDELKKAGTAEIPDRPCPKCGASAPFDDLPDEYFLFLKRS